MTQGAGSNYTNSRVVPGEPPDHALGRSRGGLSTKIHALADQGCTPVIAALTGGQAGDNPMLAAGLPHDFRTRVLGFSGCFLGVVVEVEDLLRGVVPQP